ncbi:hypothetical protein B14911_10707 [Bacillus sp. NRRL B-14911]|nr:hypothetical protein B14911_10707 [Bacillus sp. NRRL B-14911]
MWREQKMQGIDILVKENGSFKWKSNKVTSQDDIYKIVGVTQEHITLPHNIYLVVNDEAEKEPGNINLMMLWDDEPFSHHPVFGPVFLTGVTEAGQFISLTDFQKKWIARHLAHVALKNGMNVLAIDLRNGGAIA